ncbi:uncharacterized protein LOC141602409 [Silene latifolia]|uniref:uncharacterized protein LOC141602409 n=1 Tax=Silene latifolia TaxID=37657 RepID=UPI003D788869
MDPKSKPSYRKSLDNCLYIPGVGHVVPDTYSGYGSLLDSDRDDEAEVTSAFYGDQNTIVPDSLIDDVHACVAGKGICLESSRSGDLSPKSKKFNEFYERMMEKYRKKEEKAGVEIVEKKGFDVESSRSIELSPKSKKFNEFYDRMMEKFGKKEENAGVDIVDAKGITGGRSGSTVKRKRNY